MPEDQEARAREAWPLLVRRVQTEDGPFTYKELCELLGYHHRAADHFLAVIQNYCLQRGLPNLTSFAVDVKHRVPGPGYRGDRSPEGFNRELERVRRHVWPVEPPF
jgi:hypothetical protein